mmetsp:Transcript_39859/g.29413  ORF Transcript_39859/g.29413 Transcript_39859/m.29413 type:complete len:149 (-) Transcript_39859:22-468(-)
MPALDGEFMVETAHSDQIIDFSLSPHAIVTTSFDKSLIAFSTENGEQLIEAIEDLECESLEIDDHFVFTGCGNGAAVILWKFNPDSKELDLIEEIDMDLDPELQVLTFKVKKAGDVMLNAVNYKLLIQVTTVKSKLVVSTLRHQIRAF